MDLIDKVISAAPIADRSKNVELLKFTTDGIFLTVNGQRLVQFEAASDATLYKIDLNSATQAVRNDINKYFKDKVRDIINA